MEFDPITTTLGSTVSDIDLNSDLDDAVGLALHDALVDRGVLVFRDQPLLPATHVALAAALGPLGKPHPLYEQIDGFPAINRIRNDAANPPESAIWHSDLTCRPDPPFAAVLRGALIPPVGGDTLWVDMRAAAAALPQELRQRITNRSARHSMHHAFRFLEDFGQTDRQDALARSDRADNLTEHPVLVNHPVSGAEILYVNDSFTEALVADGREHDGRDADDDQELLAELLSFTRNPTFQMRMRWADNTVVMWDNWSTQHFACADHYPMYDREVQRVTVAASRRCGALAG